MNDILYESSGVRIRNVCNFNLEQTLDCGQAFRWNKDVEGHWHGVAGRMSAEIYETDSGDIIFKNTTKGEFESFWKNYFDLDRDYGEIIKALSSDEKLKAAAQYSSGIRILNQEPWEALCSFIISQNNNIPRIKGIIERLCENFGEKCVGGFSFPDAERLALLTPEDLAPLRSGFRAKYIIDAARKVSGGEIDLAALKNMDFDSAQNTLMKIKGVGPKVADCALLFGMGHIEAFPKDVWIKRAMAEIFNGELPECAVPFAGIAQQYIFYFIRSTSNP